MKTSKFSFLILCLLWLFSTACTKKEANEITPISKNSPDLQELVNMHQRSIVITDTDGQNATLRFSSTSKELLDKMPLNDFTFKVVETPASVLNQVDEMASSTSDLGQMNLSSKLARKNAADQFVKPTPVIWVDLVSNTKKQALSIEVESKAPTNQSNARTQTLYPNGTQVFFRGSTSWHRIQIDNLSANALNVSFYYNSCDGNICQTNGDLKGTFTKYSGYSYTLYYGGWAWYRNCNRAVGALITIAPNTYYHYRWTAWYGC